MKLKLTPNPENKRKSKHLGDIGESLALEKLIERGFENVQNLNDLRMNFKFADIIAERSGKRFAISVKTRCKFERLGGLNSKYNLGDKWRTHSAYAAKNLDAIPAWIAIQVNRSFYSMYFGLVSLVEESNGIPMEAEALEYYECLAKDERHIHPEHSFTPIYHKVAVGNLDSGL